MSVSHVSHDEPTRVDVWTVLKELPQRIQALLKRHDASQELGFEELEHELHALFTHAECAATSEALERHDGGGVASSTSPTRPDFRHACNVRHFGAYIHYHLTRETS